MVTLPLQKNTYTMKQLILSMLIVCFSLSLLMAQSAENKSYDMYSLLMLKPKRGHEKDFEAGVKLHNEKWHASGPHSARLSSISYGPGSDGWYVWGMGPLTYTDLDTEPAGKKEHDDDWSKNVDPHVETYGEASLWKLQDKLSYTPPNYMPDRIDVWSINIKQGKRDQFADNIEKLKVVWEEKKYPFSFRVFYSDLWNSNGADASIVFSFSNFAQFDADIPIRADYDAKYGTGSWDTWWDVFNQTVEGVDEQIREFVK
jgi:hypothetical protein